MPDTNSNFDYLQEEEGQVLVTAMMARNAVVTESTHLGEGRQVALNEMRASFHCSN